MEKRGERDRGLKMLALLYGVRNNILFLRRGGLLRLNRSGASSGDTMNATKIHYSQGLLD